MQEILTADLTSPSEGGLMTASLPIGPVILAEIVAGDFVIWVQSEVDAVSRTRTFTTLITGNEVPENATHVWSLTDSGTTWHLYELRTAVTPQEAFAAYQAALGGEGEGS